jgi:acyl-CoA thioesterase I
MKTVISPLVVALILSLTTFVRAQDASTRKAPTTRVACVGDSITFGAGMDDRANNSYPAQLQRMLGDGWDVKNFGVSGATLLKSGDRPYWKQKALERAMEFQPNVVVIKLGTNDSKPQNWEHHESFPDDIESLIRQFKQLDSKPRVFLCHPVPSFDEQWGIRDDIIRNEVIPLIDGAAREQRLKVIDLYEALNGKSELFPDGIHPNAAGAKVIAETVYKALTTVPQTAPAK